MFGAGKLWFSAGRLALAPTRLTTNVSALSASSDSGSKARLASGWLNSLAAEGHEQIGETGGECLLVTLDHARGLSSSILSACKLLDIDSPISYYLSNERSPIQIVGR